MRVRSLGLGAMALLAALMLPDTASAASPPVIRSFSVVPVNSNYESSSTSPLVLYSTGGYVDVEGDDSGGTACKARITSKPILSGLPLKAPCGTPLFSAIGIPANPRDRSVSYTFTMQAEKPKVIKAAPIVVTVSTTPPPRSVPGITPGSAWVASGASCPSPPSALEELLGWAPSNIDETFSADGNVSGSYTGSYTVEGTELSENLLVYQGVETRNLPVYVEFTFTWNPTGSDYAGTDSFGCSWTLTS